MKYDGEYRRDALKRTSKMVATINLQSISDDVLFMEASGANKRKHIRTKPRRCIPAGAKEVMAFFATDDTKVVPPGDSADPDFLPTPFEYAFEVKDVSKLSKEEDDAESCQVCGCSPCDGVLSCADDSCFNRSLMIECCEETCQCRKSCNNRRFQLGQYSNLRAKRMPDSRGWGLVCTHKLKPGDFCCEYVGERITCSDTVKRMNGMYKSLRHTYLLQLGPDEVASTFHENVMRTRSTHCVFDPIFSINLILLHRSLTPHAMQICYGSLITAAIPTVRCKNGMCVVPCVLASLRLRTSLLELNCALIIKWRCLTRNLSR